MAFTTATRQNLILLLGVVGKSGSGKTKSGLLLARGLVGPKGRIAAIDSENRRMSYFADDPSVAPFESADLQPPYGPDRYLELLNMAFKEKYDAVVIDSLSHEWNGEGGCLSMVDKELDEKAGNDWAKRDKYKMFAWGRVTPKHDKLVSAICRSPVPIICCFRAKDKIVMDQSDTPGQPRKTTITTDEDAPVQRKDLIHEMTMVFQVEQRDGVGGYFNVRKRTTQGLYEAVQSKGNQLSVAHGQALADWCANSGRAKTDKTKVATDATRTWMLEQLSDLHAKMFQWAIDRGFILPNGTLEEIPLKLVPTNKAELAKLRAEIEAHA